MTPVATLTVPVYRSRPADGDELIGEAEANVGGRPGMIRLTRRGLYLVMLDPRGDGPSWGVDLNALARALVDTVAPPVSGTGDDRP